MTPQELQSSFFKLFYFYYPNRGFGQIKILIPNIIYEQSKLLPENEVKSFLRRYTKGEEWFTNRSPLFEAIETGILKHYGGSSPCYVNQIPNQK